jgi:hypothetical protein
VIWRIVGARAAPDASATTPEQLEPVLGEHLPSDERAGIAATVHSWFESGEAGAALQPEYLASVADLVFDGVGPRRSETAIWAIGAIAPDLVVDRVRRRWSSGEIESFFEAAIRALNDVATPASGAGDHSVPAGNRDDSGFRAALKRAGLVGAFAWLERGPADSRLKRLHPTVSNLIETLTALSPDRFPSLVAGLEAPAMQLTAARRTVERESVPERRAPLDWITDQSSEVLIALAIVHVARAAAAMEGGGGIPAGSALPDGAADEPRGPVSGGMPADSAGDPLRQLVARLRRLKPPACLRWIGEVMTNGPNLLGAAAGEAWGLPIRSLEEECARSAADLFDRHWSPDLVSHFQSGLGWDRRRSRVRHQAAVAWALRETSAERAATLARALLEEHRRTLHEPGAGKWTALDGDDGNDRAWLEGLGTALALSADDLDLPAWVEAQCRDLPLSAWDAEADPNAFAAADRTARHWLLVALLAVPRRAELGRTVPPAAVRTLAEFRWEHSRFCRRYLDGRSESSFAAELTARFAVEFGRVDDQWMLEQMRSEGVGPRAVWALIEEWRLRRGDPVEANLEYHEMILREFIRIAANRFGDGAGFDLEGLEFWARLWIDLETAEQAERTALAIASFPLRVTDRKWRLLALRLLAVVVRHRKPSRDAGELVRLFYQQLWPVYRETPSSEEADRRQIDEAFGRSGLAAT